MNIAAVNVNVVVFVCYSMFIFYDNDDPIVNDDVRFSNIFLSSHAR